MKTALIVGVLVILGVFSAGVAVVVPVIVSGVSGSSGVEASCPACQTRFRIKGVEGMTVRQQLFKQHSCPFCGCQQSVYQFRLCAQDVAQDGQVPELP